MQNLKAEMTDCFPTVPGAHGLRMAKLKNFSVVMVGSLALRFHQTGQGG